MADVGVLALQGDFQAHGCAIRALGHRPREVRVPADLAGLAALVLPGGESGTMLRLLAGAGLNGPLGDFCRSGRTVLGTCAGAILMAQRVTGPAQASLDLLDIDVERNAYGRQLDSFIAPLDGGTDELHGVEGVFIRAPIVRRTGPGVDVLLRHAGQPVLVREGPRWAATFHPELGADGRVLARVLDGIGA